MLDSLGYEHKFGKETDSVPYNILNDAKIGDSNGIILGIRYIFLSKLHTIV